MIQEARQRPAAPVRNRQEVLAVPEAAAVGLTQQLIKHDIELKGIDDFRCPLSLCCIIGPVYRVQNGDSASPHYQYYDKAMLDLEFKAGAAKKDPLTNKILSDENIKDGTEQYRKEFMAMVAEALKSKGLATEKIPSVIAELQKEFFGSKSQLDPSKRLGA